MNFPSVLSQLISLNLLLFAGYILLKWVTWILLALKTPLSAKAELRLLYSTLLTVIILAILQPALPQPGFFTPPVKAAINVWSLPSPLDYQNLVPGNKSFDSTKTAFLSISHFSQGSSLEVNQLTRGILISLAAILLIALLKTLWELRVLNTIAKDSFLIRKIGKVEILANSQLQVPFSFWNFSKAIVIVPVELISNSETLKTIVRHELQHHRQRDTYWAYLFLIIKTFCFYNPLARLWLRWIVETQEFACDEALVDHGKVSSRQYARCLLEVAQSAFQQKQIPLCARGLLFSKERHLLKRRIEKMLNKLKASPRRSIPWLIPGALSIFLAFTTYASKGFIQDRRISVEEANKMLESARLNTDFPLVINEAVLRQLNRYLGTPEGRGFIKASLLRMENYQSLVGGKIQEYSLPSELAAVPIVESGYQNLPQGVNPSNKSAGVWQFIPSTARTFGLLVNHEKDERLNTHLATDAAMRYLKATYLELRDWQLSLMAYNSGSGRVQEGIRKIGSRDAWTLIRGGFESDRDYLAKVIAAILILKNKSKLED